MTMMVAARMHNLGDIRVDKIEKPCPGKGEVLLRVETCAVCGSDCRIFRHGNDRVTYPAVLGHEIAGVVESVGENVASLAPGDRVALGADVPSMQDDWAKNGMANLSDINYAIGYQFPGGFAQYCLLNKLTVDFGPVAKIHNRLDFELASLAEPLGCCINGLDRVRMRPGKTVLIIGTGPIGLMLARTARAFGAVLVVLADQDAERVRQAQEFGEPYAFNSADTDLESLVTKFGLKRQGFDAVLTACPSPRAQEQAVRLVAKRGVINLFGGLPAGNSIITFDSNILHYKEASVTGSHGSTPMQHKQALELIASGRIDVFALITHRFPLSQIDQAFDTVEQRKGLKVIVQPWI